mmetsp:Transcript_45095/g.107200  ORF Transcript_45095/g.107200 Transcript_45095/m.107200 type:complete len:1048 (-) Transcript_45095:114-3257(-)|eukprot:CAMPEP_0178468088 /NCGR_PEP_ID=MMETSP0689_2-20121128/52741_1 /TAXON_ID=160604 /ORGANISM="Amphidinium massartii, Strain CS-259" /LENGTH=1047 /DNA_ID=CAMNT_0020095137 /DNA_START=64 /DNA_END=3207 /DNA_ORIENTATION=-
MVMEVAVIDVEGPESPKGPGSPPGTAGDVSSHLGASMSRPMTSPSDPSLNRRPNSRLPSEGWGADNSGARSTTFSMSASQSSPDVHTDHHRSALLPADQSRPSTSASACRPSTSASTRGSGRFSPEEMICFKRLPQPSSQESYDDKVDTYWLTHGGVRRGLMETNWHTLPVLKGQFYNHPKLSEHLLKSVAKARRLRRPPQAAEKKAPDALPEEDLTAAVLEEIYPKVRKESNNFVSDQYDESEVPAINQDLGAVRRTSKARGNKRASTVAQNAASAMTLAEATAVRSPPGSMVNAASAGVPPGTTPSASSSTPAAAASKDKDKDSSTHAGNLHSNIMMEFRRRLLEKFSTTKEAFDALSHELPMDKELSKKELRRVLHRQGLESTREERDAIFDALDVDKSGHLSMAQFHIAVEAAAPVRTVGDLRRRWLASGFTSMAAAVSLMDEGMTRSRRLTLKEFGEALSRVSVPDALEHAAIFNIVLDPHDKQGRVSIAELASAIASVSPSLDLEDLRDKVVRRYSGKIERAYGDLDPKHRGDMDRHTFVSGLMRRLGCTEADANKIFRKIDIDGNGDVSREEFATALELSEPSLFHEDLRLRIRQRFRSIQDTFKEAFSETTGEDVDEIPALSLEKFQELLLPLGLTESEISKLFKLVDLDGDMTLTVKEFLKGIKFFAPSCVLEDLRMQCLQRAPYITDVFKEVDRTEQLDRVGFTQTLAELDLLAGVSIDSIFDLLDVRNDGQVSIGMLIAALKSGGPGSRLRLPEGERNDRARHEVLGFTSSATKLCKQLKNTVRLGADHGGEEEAPQENRVAQMERQQSSQLQHSQTGSSSQPSSPSRRTQPEQKKLTMPINKGGTRMTGKEIFCIAAAQNYGSRQDQKQSDKQEQNAGGRDTAQAENIESATKTVAEAALSGAAPRLRTVPSEEISKYVFRFVRSTPGEGIPQTASSAAGKQPAQVQSQERMQEAQQSWNDVWKHLNRHPDKKRKLAIVKNLHGYFQQAASSLSHDVTLLQNVPSRFANQQSIRAHEAALEVKPKSFLNVPEERK